MEVSGVSSNHVRNEPSEPSTETGPGPSAQTSAPIASQAINQAPLSFLNPTQGYVTQHYGQQGPPAQTGPAPDLNKPLPNPPGGRSNYADSAWGAMYALANSTGNELPPLTYQPAPTGPGRGGALPKTTLDPNTGRPLRENPGEHFLNLFRKKT